MAARDVIKNLNLFVDGRGYAGQLQEFTPPALTLVLEEFRAGGMNAPVELTMGMEKLEASGSIIAYDRDVLAQFGVQEGFTVPFVLRTALESTDGTVTAAVHTMRGKLRKLDSGTITPGQLAPLSFEMSLSYYKLQHGDVVVHEIDVENMVYKVNGTDILSSQRTALGL